MSDTLNTKIDAYYAARQAYDEFKKLSDEADRIRRAREAELVDYMIENQIKSVDRADGSKPLLVNSVSISVVKENAESIREWIRGLVGDDKDYVETLPNKSAVLELVKTKLQVDLMDPSEFPAFLKVDTRPSLRVNGWKGRE